MRSYVSNLFENRDYFKILLLDIVGKFILIYFMCKINLRFPRKY